jgi:hypothetical protein
VNISSESTGDLLSAASLLLTVVSILYGLWYPEIIKAIETEVPSHPQNRVKPHKEVSAVLWYKAIPLAIIAAPFGLIFLPDAVAVVCRAIRILISSGEGGYDAVETAFCVVVLFSLAIGVYTFRLAWVLNNQRVKLSS